MVAVGTLWPLVKFSCRVGLVNIIKYICRFSSLSVCHHYEFGFLTYHFQLLIDDQDVNIEIHGFSILRRIMLFLICFSLSAFFYPFISSTVCCLFYFLLSIKIVLSGCIWNSYDFFVWIRLNNVLMLCLQYYQHAAYENIGLWIATIFLTVMIFLIGLLCYFVVTNGVYYVQRRQLFVRLALL